MMDNCKDTNIYVDVKKTVWVRYSLNDDVNIEEVKQILEDTKDYKNILDDKYLKESEILFGTFKDIEVNKDNDKPVIELYKGCEIVYSNPK